METVYDLVVRALSSISFNSLYPELLIPGVVILFVIFAFYIFGKVIGTISVVAIALIMTMMSTLISVDSIVLPMSEPHDFPIDFRNGAQIRYPNTLPSGQIVQANKVAAGSMNCDAVVDATGKMQLACERVDYRATDCLQQGELSECIDKKAIVEQLYRGQYAFNEISEMTRGEPEQVSLVIQGKELNPDIQNLEGYLAEMTGEIKGGELPTSGTMEAELSGRAFTIVPEGRVSKQMSNFTPTQWDWEVKPNREGKHRLTLSVYVVISKGGQKVAEERPLAERRLISVEVGGVDQIKDWIAEVDPIRGFFTALGGVLMGVLGFFGIKNFGDAKGKISPEDKPAAGFELSAKAKKDSEGGGSDTIESER